MNDTKMSWWQEARFGMIIHWGLYSIPAGEWKDQVMDYIGEWIQSRFEIPNSEYGKFAESFNPTKFDADEWVRIAKRAGMDYLIITSKHHDGFAMYHSKCDAYNIVDATPFGRDPLAELSQACAKHGVKFCFYYSQDLDWHHPDGGGHERGHTNHGMSWTNDWDYPDREAKDFTRYFESKAKPQLLELLTGYGPIGMVWFDCPLTLSREQSQELYDMVTSCQPQCIMNSRLGNGLGDYRSLGDNEIPQLKLDGFWEAVGTLNDTWGYKSSDDNWKSSDQVIRLLTGLAGKGINYALNVGPKGDGSIPIETIDILEEVGHWMALNSTSVKGTTASPFVCDLPWGPVTAKGKTIFIHLHNPPSDGEGITINGLAGKMSKVYLLSTGEDLPARSDIDAWASGKLVIDPQQWSSMGRLPVLALEFEAEPIVSKTLMQQGNGEVNLPVANAILSSDTVTVGLNGVIAGWHDTSISSEWDFDLVYPGKYKVAIVTSGLHYKRGWQGGHVVDITIFPKKFGQASSESLSEKLHHLAAQVVEHEPLTLTSTSMYTAAMTYCGNIELAEPGRYHLTVSAREIVDNGGVGFALMKVILIPEKVGVQQ